MHAKNIVVVGLTGTHGAGKGTIAEYLKGKGFRHFSARELLWLEVDRRNMPRNRDSLNKVANDLRQQFGADYVAFALYDAARMFQEAVVIESIYTVGEIERIRAAAASAKQKFVLLAVDADPKERHRRMTEQRKGEGDMISFEAFLEQEQREMESDDPQKHNLVACRKLADAVFMNDGTVKEFHSDLDSRLPSLGVIDSS